MNIDASFHNSSKSAGFGALIRNSRGELMAAISAKLPDCRDAFQAEARAFLQSLLWIRDIGMTGVHLETDCLNLVTALNAPPNTWATDLDHILEAAHRLITGVQVPDFKHIRRKANKAAHALGQYSQDIQEDMVVWMEDGPQFLEDIMRTEIQS